MFDEENYYDYESILEDTDPLYEDEDYSDDEYNYSNEREFDCYYHNIIDELDYWSFSSMDATWWDKYSIINHNDYLSFS